MGFKFKKSKPKPKPKVVIDYPPVPTKKWVPPDQRAKKKRKPKYVKPEGLSQRLTISSLEKAWHHFLLKAGHYSVLNGHFSQYHKRFILKTNGHQGACNSVVAIVFAKLHEMLTWHHDLIDQVLELGDQLYQKSHIFVENKCKTFLDVLEVYPSFYVGDLKITMTYKGEKFIGKLFPDFDDSPHLVNVIKDFFKVNNSGIVCAQKKHWAIWAVGDFYYMFDAGDHKVSGYAWDDIVGQGVSCLMRFADTDVLVHMLHENVNKADNAKFEITPCAILRMVKLENKPPLLLAEIEEAMGKIPPKVVDDEGGGPVVRVIIKKKVVEEVVEAIDIPEEHESYIEAQARLNETDEFSPDMTVSREPSLAEEDGSNLPIVARRKISESMIPLEHAKAESVTYFLSLIPHKMGILRGTTHQRDPNFTKFDGRQSIGNAIAALTMLRYEKAKNWVPKMIDIILKFGDRIHQATKRSITPEQKVNVTNIYKQVAVNDRNFTPVVDEYTVVGKLNSKNEEILDLLPALQEFFRDHEAGVITGPINLAVWSEDGYYYMFDPNDRDKNGLAIPKKIKFGSEVNLSDFPPGVACITWYKELADLVAIYMKNVDKAAKRDPFVISKVQIKDYVECAEPWNCFEGVAVDKWILRGSINQNNRAFPREIRNNQSIGVSVLALSYNKIYPVETWTNEVVDEIVTSGNDYYNNAVETLKASDKFISPMLLVTEVPKKFVLSGKEVNLDIEDCLFNGLLDAKDENDVLNLKRAIEEFFIENETGIVTCRQIAIALWKDDDDTYYYFDSHSRDEDGIMGSFGTACVLRMFSIAELAKTIESNLGPGADNFFNISRLGITIWEMSEDGIVRPPLHNYKAVDQDRAILRSVFSVDSAIFKLNRGKQTIPMCIVAIGMTKVNPAAIWSRDVLDEVLFLGNRLYMASMVFNEKAELPEEEDVDEIHSGNTLKEYKIGLNNITITYQDAREGNIEEHLEDTLNAFFDEEDTVNEDHREFLLESSLITVAGWKENGVYFLFDPQPRDNTGQIYGNDEWSAKIIPEEESEEDEDEGEEENENEGAERYDEDDDDDEEEIRGGVVPKPPPTPVTPPPPTPPPPPEDEEVTSEERRSVASQVDTLEEEGPPPPPPMPKHSEHYWSVMAENGRAFAMWFTTKELVISHILENTPPNKREEAFKLLPLVVENKPELKDVFDPESTAPRQDYYSGDWYEFKEIEHGRWILRGTMDQTHKMFPVCNRGRQAVANCFTALSFATLYAFSKYKTNTIDNMLKYGDRLYTSTRNIRKRELHDNKALKLSEEEIELILEHEILGVEEMIKCFCIGTDQTILEVEPKAIIGDLNAQNFEDVLDVKRGLELFFETNRMGIIEAKGSTVAIWRGEKVFFMYDPMERGPNGVKVVNGEACITRYLDIELMAKVYLQNIVKEGKNEFVIHKVTISAGPCPKEKKPVLKPPPEQPKLIGYQLVVPGKMVLRGSFSQDDPIFGRGRNAQCAAIAVVALSMTLVHRPEKWTKPIVDEIVTIGDELYMTSMDSLGFEFNPWEQGMTVILVNRDYQIGKLKANCELRNTEQRGIIDIKHPKILNIRAGIEKFFEENTHGVIETEPLTLAIWEEEEPKYLIYVFDPNPRGPSGLPLLGGTACVCTFETPKMVSDHIISCILDKDQLKGEFVITPTEIVVGNAKTKGRKHIHVEKKPIMEKFCEQRHRNLPPSYKDRKKLRKMAEEERYKKEAAKQAKIGLKEFYGLSGGDAILRGTKSQNSSEFCPNSRNKQDIANCIVAFVMARMIPITDWNYKQIDMVLESGDPLYKDSYIAYSPKDPKLGLENILRKFFIRDVRVTVTVYKPVLTNQLLQTNLELALLNYFQQEQFCMLTAYDEWVAIFYKGGVYYMFDPHERDAQGNRTTCKGAAFVMKFPDVNNLVTKFMGNVITSTDETIRMFSLVLVTVKEIIKVERDDDDNPMLYP